MSSFSSLNRRTGFARKMSLALASLCLASAAAFGDDLNPPASGQAFVSTAGEKPSRIGPELNDIVGNARVLVPDGTSVFQVAAVGDTRWFVFGAEAGKTYTVEAINPYGDLGNNGISAMDIRDSTGLAAPPQAAYNCARNTVAPSFEVSLDGARCVIRTFIPDAATTLNKRGVYISVLLGFGNNYQIRVRESTIYGRWTVNGYDFHVELQNTTTDSVCVQVVPYPGTGQNALPAGTITTATTLTIPPMGANKTVFPNGVLRNGDNKGALRIHDCGSSNFVAGSLQMNTYAYNPVTAQFIQFSNSTVNGGSSNSW